MRALRKKNSDMVRELLMNKYGITENSLKSDTEILRKWLESRPDLPKPKHVEQERWLENQLLMVKTNLEKAKVSIELYCMARVKYPRLFIGRDISCLELLQSFEILTISTLPSLTPLGDCLIVVRIDDPDQDKFNFEAHIKRCSMIMEYYLKEGLEFSGFHILLDLKNLRLGHLMKFNLEQLRTMKFIMKAYPASFSRIHIINYPTFIETAVAVFKPFLSKKLHSRMKFCKDVNLLHEDLPLNILPTDYGGVLEAPKEWSDVWKSRFEEIRDYIEESNQIQNENIQTNL